MASAFQASAFQHSPAFQMEAVAPVVEGPRGARISDEKVDKARRKRWKRRIEESEDLRRVLSRLMQGLTLEEPEILETIEVIDSVLPEAGPDQGLIDLRNRLMA